MKPNQLLWRLKHGHFSNVRFNDLVRLVEAVGFQLRRVRGSHHVFAHEDDAELVNLQNVSGQAKPYQLRQVFSLIEKYNLRPRER